MKKLFLFLLVTLFFAPLSAQDAYGKWPKEQIMPLKKLTVTPINVVRDTTETYNVSVNYTIRFEVGKREDVYRIMVHHTISVLMVENAEKYLQEELNKELESYKILASAKPRAIMAFMSDDDLRYLAKRDKIKGKIYNPGKILWATSEY